MSQISRISRMHDMACLADAPPLALGQDEPTSEIELMRLGKFHHPKFGRWHITRETFASFVANFGQQGRALLDFDHAPEKGGPTEAAGWITALAVVGDTLRATVQFTKIGAAAVRDRRYLYVSPTWSFAAKDAQGKPLGAKLIGAALTNRPFFTDLPTLALTPTAEALASLNGVPVQTGYGECPCPHCGDRPDADFDEHFSNVAGPHGIDPAHRSLYQHYFWRNSHLHGNVDDELKIAEAGRAQQRTYWAPIRAREQARAERLGAPDTAHGGAGPVVFSAPEGLDPEGELVHAGVVAIAQEFGIDDYMTAFAALVDHRGPPPMAYPNEPPLRQVDIPADATDEEAAAWAELERRARALATRHDIDWVEATMVVELDDRLAELEAEDGSDDAVWLDTSRAQLAEPWNDAHYERDARRAATLEWTLTKDKWLAGAENGLDIVYDEAVKRRAEALAQARYKRDRELAEAQQREQRRRKSAIEDELRRRAERRLGG